MSISIKRNGIDISSSIEWPTIDIRNVLTKETGTCKFSILKTPATLGSIPALKDTIAVYDSSGIIWGGVVTELNPIIRGGKGGILLEYQITCTDYGYILDAKVVKSAFANQDPKDIVASLMAQYAPPDFDYTTYVQRGNFSIASISFNYEPLTKCLERLAKQVGWDWYVDPNKALHFYFATTQSGSSELYTAPFNIDENEGMINMPSVNIDYNITNLKNSIYVVGGTYEKNVTSVDKYLTDGIQKAWALQYNYTFSTMTVTLGGVTQTLGQDQVTDPTTVQCLYNTASHFIYFVSGGVPTAPTTGQTIVISGQANIPILAHVQNTQSINLYGEYQDSIVNKQIKTISEAQERAQADLIMFGHPIYDVKFDTLNPGLRIGQTILLNSTLFGVPNYPLVIKNIEAIGYTPGDPRYNTKTLKYQVEAIGSDNVTFTDIMMTLLQQNNAQTTTDSSTVLEVLITIEEIIAMKDPVSIFGSTTGQYVWGIVGAKPGSKGEYASSKYASLAYGGSKILANSNATQMRWDFATWG